jgi:hypothetical protein
MDVSETPIISMSPNFDVTEKKPTTPEQKMDTCLHCVQQVNSVGETEDIVLIAREKMQVNYKPIFRV